MKRILWILAVAGAVLSSCTSKSSEPANKAEQVIAALNDPASRYVVVACHRGDWRNYPENSLGAIESVIRMGADIVEIDLKEGNGKAKAWGCDLTHEYININADYRS